MVSSRPAPPEADASIFRRVFPKLLLSIALGALFAFLVSRGGVPLVPPARAFAHVTWWAIPLYVATLLVTHWFRAWRWRFLVAPIQRVPLKDVIALNWIGFFAIFAFPLRLGEFARPALGKMKCGIPISTGLGTVAVERVVDGLVTSLCVAFALVVLPRATTDDAYAKALPFYGYLALAVFSSALVALALFLWKRRFAIAVTTKIIGLVSPRLAATLSAKVGQVADGLRSISEPRFALPFLGETLVYWGINCLGMWCLGRGCGLPMTFGHAVAVMGVLAIGILPPAGPGLFGSFQLAMFAALKFYFPESVVANEGAVYVFLLYVTQALFLSVTGVIPLFLTHVRFRDLLRVQPSGADALSP